MKTEDRGFVCRKAARLYKWRCTAATTLLSSVLCPLSSVAETRPDYVPPPPAVSSGSITQIIFSLLLVLATIVLVGWLLRRVNVAQHGSGNLLKVLGSVAVGQRERIVLVEVNDTCLVVGVGTGQIRTLHTFQKTDDREQKTEDKPTISPPENKFSSLLSSIIRPQSSDKKRDAP